MRSTILFIFVLPADHGGESKIENNSKDNKTQLFSKKENRHAYKL
jgi:hypothetical protein